jgi:hypothetical protein
MESRLLFNKHTKFRECFLFIHLCSKFIILHIISVSVCLFRCYPVDNFEYFLCFIFLFTKQIQIYVACLLVTISSLLFRNSTIFAHHWNIDIHIVMLQWTYYQWLCYLWLQWNTHTMLVRMAFISCSNNTSIHGYICHYLCTRCICIFWTRNDKW